jgi:hypothetical protein
MFVAELNRSIKHGAPFFAEYRVVVGDRLGPVPNADQLAAG